MTAESLMPPELLMAVTYKCNAACKMCNIWKHPTEDAEEVGVEHIRSLPGGFRFMNVTGGEPFLRPDIADIVETAMAKAERVVVSSNGYFTDKMVEVAKAFPKVGFRISIEGLPGVNDRLRGLKDGFDHGLRSLLRLKDAGCKDIGFGITVTDANADDLLELYSLADSMGMEFATAAAHNTYYFHKFDNAFAGPDRVASRFMELSGRLLSTWRLKNWFRAYFNYGLANYVLGNPRLLPCKAASDLVFIDPFGDVRACNAMDEPMGNIKTTPLEEIMAGDEAARVREKVRACPRRCWMIGSVAPAMRRQIAKPAWWVLKNKVRTLLGRPLPPPVRK